MRLLRDFYWEICRNSVKNSKRISSRIFKKFDWEIQVNSIGNYKRYLTVIQKKSIEQLCENLNFLKDFQQDVLESLI